MRATGGVNEENIMDNTGLDQLRLGVCPPGSHPLLRRKGCVMIAR